MKTIQQLQDQTQNPNIIYSTLSVSFIQNLRMRLHTEYLNEDMNWFCETQKKMMETPIMKHPTDIQGLKRSPVTSLI